MTTQHAKEFFLYPFPLCPLDTVQCPPKHFMNASNCQISYLQTNVKFLAKLRMKKSLRTRKASGIKIEATTDQIHSNRYLLISGLIASAILSTHSRACGPTQGQTRTHRGVNLTIMFFHWLIFSGIRATIAITWNSIPVYRRIQRIMSIIRLN